VTNAAKTFPSDFYVAVATVIPVLFLALALQGPTYETMISTALRYLGPYFKRMTFRSVAGAIVGTLLMALAGLVILFALSGEVVALNASAPSRTRLLIDKVYWGLYLLCSSAS
jgi:hypothetical protein